MSKEKTGIFQKIVQKVSSEMADKVLTDLDKKAKRYVTQLIHDVTKKIMIMVVGFFLALIGSLFLFVGLAKFLNETLHSTWLGWGIGGLVTIGIGLLVYAVSRH